MGFSRLSGSPNDDALRKRSGEPAGQACRLLLSGLVPRRRVGQREASVSGAILPWRRYRGLRRVGVRMVIAASEHKDLTAAAELADKLVAMTPPTPMAAVQAQQPLNELQEMREEIA
ncbi:hypothetical protein MRX96_022520 [Rhipicephalus microplus]